jgi:hypothetical protein
MNGSNENDLAAHMAEICRDPEDIHRCVQPCAVMELQGAKQLRFANPIRRAASQLRQPRAAPPPYFRPLGMAPACANGVKSFCGSYYSCC